MKNYIALTNVDTKEVFSIDISGVDFLKVAEQLNQFPKNEKGAPQVGNIRIHQYGGAAAEIKSKP